MSTYLAADGYSLAYGLNWASIANSKREASEMRAFARSVHAEYKVRWDGTQGVKYAFARSAPSVGGRKILSAAILFASVVPRGQNSLLVYQIDRRQTAIIALLAGEQYLDLVVDSATAEDKIRALDEEGHGAYVAYGNHPAYSDCEAMSPADLLAGDKSAASLGKFVDPRKTIKTVAIALTAIGVVGASTLWHIEKKKREAEELRKKQIDPVAAYTGEVKRMLAGAGFNGKAASSAIWDVIKSRSADVGGWTLQKVECQPTQCKETWLQRDGDIMSFNSAIKGPHNVTFSAGSPNLFNTFAVEGKRSALAQESLPKSADFWPAAITQQQRLRRIGIEYVPTAAAISGLSAGVASTSIPSNLIVLRGTLTITAPIGFANDILLHYVPMNMRVETLSIDLAGDLKAMKIIIKGYYYVNQ